MSKSSFFFQLDLLTPDQPVYWLFNTCSFLITRDRPWHYTYIQPPSENKNISITSRALTTRKLCANTVTFDYSLILQTPMIYFSNYYINLNKRVSLFF